MPLGSKLSPLSVLFILVAQGGPCHVRPCAHEHLGTAFSGALEVGLVKVQGTGYMASFSVCTYFMPAMAS